VDARHDAVIPYVEAAHAPASVGWYPRSGGTAGAAACGHEPIHREGEAEVEAIHREGEVKDMSRNRHNTPRDETTRMVHSQCQADTYSWLRTLRAIRGLPVS
jgi:hypothetical protein